MFWRGGVPRPRLHQIGASTIANLSDLLTERDRLSWVKNLKLSPIAIPFIWNF